jgi:gliding motility-associated-like protein
MVFSQRFTLIIALFCCFFSSALLAQSTLQKAIVENGFKAYGNSIAQLRNGNLVAVGYVDPLVNPLDWAGSIWQLDTQGDVENTLHTDADTSNVIDLYQQVAASPSGGFGATFISAGENSEDYGGIIACTDAGNVLWERRLSGSGLLFEDIEAASDGYIVSAYSTTNLMSLVQKYSVTGDLVWSTSLMVSLDGGDLAVGADGAVYAVGRLGSDGVLIRLSATGALVFAKRISTDQQVSLNQVATAGNQIVIAGTRGNANSNLWVLRSDLQGNIGQSAQFALDNEDLGPKGIVLNADGGSVIALSQTNSSSENGALLLSLTDNLTTVWSRNYSNINNGNCNFNALVAVSEGYLLAGNYAKNTAVNSWVVQTNREGQVLGVCCATDIALTRSNVTSSSADFNPVSTTAFTPLPIERLHTQPTATSQSLCPADQSQVIIGDTDGILCPGECISISLVNAAASGVNYKWRFPTGVPDSSIVAQPGEVCFNTPGKIAVTLTGNGCLLHTDSLQILGGGDRYPNAFTPDQATNSIFRPIVICGADDYHLEVFNRWGDLIFESFRYEEGWDGTANGEPAPPDTYIYRVEYYSSRNGERVLVSNEQREVLLLR